MSISSRIHDTVEDWQAEWKDRLRGWALRTISEGVKKFFEDDEPAAIDNVADMITKLRANPNLPPELKTKLDKLEEGGSWFMIVMAIVMGVQAIIGLVTTLWQPGLKQMAYPEERIAQNYRFDPISVVTAWRRDPEKYAGLFDDLKDLGWSDERIEAMKFFTLTYPSRQDGIRYVAKEALEPDSIAKYGLLDEFDRIDLSLFNEIGVPEETVKLDWIAHWDHPPLTVIIEMLHRGLLNEQDVYEYFRLIERPPFWRAKEIETYYTWPTRVDVRRWWDMRTIDETELRRLYSGMGYRGVNLDNYILWTKVYTAFPDLIARWTKGWITIDDVRTELVSLGMPAARVDEFIQMKVKAEQPARTTAERDITKTDIYKGVKQDRITRAEGLELLMELGYDEDEADYLLAINIPEDEAETAVKARQLSKSDIIAGLRSEVLTESEARSKLLELRYTPLDAELLLDIFKASIKPPVEEKKRQASKADIVLAVKKGLITEYEGYLMLLELGFTPEASNFILMVKAESSPFSPVNFGEFKDLTDKWRRAAGMTTPAFNDKLKSAGVELVRISDEVKALQETVRTEELLLVDQDAIPEEAEKRLKELRVSLNRAIAEKERLQSAYNALVAEFRQTEV